MFRCSIPEGVEVKLSADVIRPLVVDKTVIAAYTTDNSRYKGNNSRLGIAYKDFTDFNSEYPTKVKAVDVHGKFMYWTFTESYYMFCTFGMTGQWSPIKGKHPCFVFDFDDGSHIYFNDPRHFGTIHFTDKAQELIDKLNKLGWDPLQGKSSLLWERICKICSHSKKPIGQLLMDQSVFAGVGNYIRAEALYLAKISPWRQCNSLTQREIESLCQNIIDVMQESYKYQGATILTYKTVYGEEGRYSSFFKVYGQKFDPLGNQIVKENTPDGRTIHWCPTIQK